jgi:hypothetical protein
MRGADFNRVDDRRQGQREFEHRKVVADARPWPGPEG